MTILFIISELLLIISFILKKKTEKELDITNFLCLSIILLFCYNTLICYILTFFTIPCKLWILSIINFLVDSILIYLIFKNKKIQKYKFSKIDILYIPLLIVIIFAVCYIDFGFPFDIKYISADPAMHYLTSRRFAEQETLMPNSLPDPVYGKMETRKPASYVNSGLLMKCFCEDLEPVSCYYIFAGFDIFILIMISITLYTALKKYAKKQEHFLWAFIVALICTLGYPLNSLLFGFEYLTLGLLILIAIIDFVYYYENSSLSLTYVLLIFGLLNFGLFCSYFMFVPFVYPALWIYFYIKEHKETKKKITKKIVLLWLITLLIPFALGYIYHLEPKIYAVIINQVSDVETNVNYSASNTLNKGFAVDGFIYINLFSNMLLLVPLPIYLIIKDFKDNKLRNNKFLALILFLTVVFIEVLLIGNRLEKVSIYYLSKNYFALWIILAFLNYKALVYIFENNSKYLSRLFISGYILLMIIYIIQSNVKVIESKTNNDENLISVMEIFGANKTILKHSISDYNQKELEIIKYANENLDFNTRIEIVADHRTYYWAYPLLGYTDKDEVYNTSKYGEQAELQRKWLNLSKKLKNEKDEMDYIIYFKRSKIYMSLKKVIFENSEIIYENEYGGILKYNK